MNPQIDKPFELESSIKTGGISRRMDVEVLQDLNPIATRPL